MSTSTKIIIALLVLVLLVVARKPRSASDKHGDSISPALQVYEAPDPTLTELTVASFNIQTGKDIQGERDVSRSAAVLQAADIIGVQEVYAPSWLNRLGVGTAQAKVLAGDYFAHLFAATRVRWFLEHRGNLLLSKVPVGQWQVSMLPDVTGSSFRNMTIAEMEWLGTPFVFINTHLHTSTGREQQLEAVLAEFAKHPRAILVGDFNSRPDTPQLREAIDRGDFIDAIKAARLDVDNPNRIDWILCKGFKVMAGEMVEKGISDHPYYQVSLTLD
ncbi:MAG: endonuclease/exonuclease/phosphatase family protein [Pseudomonadota bacterium]